MAEVAKSAYAPLVCKIGAGQTDVAVASGTALYALPLSKCWTKACAARECWPVMKALMEASARNPNSAILKADATWVCLHLVFEKKTRAGSKCREAHLKSLPEVAPADCGEDFSSLEVELGPAVMQSLHLSKADYSWARAVLDKFGTIFLGENGERVEALVPGVEFMTQPSSAQAAPNPSDVRLEGSDANFTEPTVVVYAGKSYDSKEKVVWNSMRKYKVPGVPFVVTFPYTETGKAVVEPLCRVLGGSMALKTGDSCPAEDDARVQIVTVDGKAMVKVTLYLTKEEPLPAKSVMSLIGVGLLADPGTLASCIADEKDIPGVMEEFQCDIRALRILKPSLAKLQSGASGEDSKIIGTALDKLDARMTADSAPKQSMTKSIKELVAISPATAKTIEWPADADQTFEMFKASPKLMSSAGDLSHLKVLLSCLQSSSLGDPSTALVPQFPSKDAKVEAFGEASLAAKAQFEKQTDSWLSKAGKDVSPVEKASAYFKLGMCMVQAYNYAGAKGAFEKSISSFPTKMAAAKLLECVQKQAAMGTSHHTPHSKIAAAFGDTLALMKKVLVKMGFTKGDVPLPVRAPSTLASALVSSQAEAGSALAEAVSTSEEVSELAQLVRLFMLHVALPVKTVRLLLGAKVCASLLGNGILVAADPATGAKKAAKDAVAEVTDPKKRGADVVFSSVALQSVGGLLVASDFDYGYCSADYDPVPYVAQDSAALAASATALPLSGSKALADSIAAGLAAAAGGAKVTFMGSSRFQALAALSAHLNGFKDCQFVEKTSDKFDVVLSSVVRLPNPSMVINTKGPMFKDGMEETWKKTLQTNLNSLQPKGALLMTSMITNSGGDIAKLVSEQCRAAVFTSKPSKAEDLLKLLATGCEPVHYYAYMTGLKASGVSTVSESVVLAWKRPSGVAAVSEKTVEMMPESKGLWEDSSSLQSRVESAYGSLQASADLQAMVGSGGGSMYDMNWDDEGSTTASDAQEEAPKPSVPSASPWAATKSKRALTKKLKKAERSEQLAGAPWDEIGSVNTMGWAPPINIHSTWRVCPEPQKITEMPPSEFPRVGIVEMKGIKIPSEFMDAMRDTFDCKNKFTFGVSDKGKPQFTPATAGRGSRRRRRGMGDDDEAKATIDDCPIIIVPFPPGSYDDIEATAPLPTQVLYFCQAITDKVRMNAKHLIIFLSCNAFGPMMEEYSETVSKVGALTGMGRTVRAEVKEFDLWNVDCDNFMPGGDMLEVMAQLSLELNCPDHNFEICWRKGKRFIRSFELSARNPLRGSSVGPSFPWTADEPDGVIFITGGTGGLGVVSAEALAEAGAKKIVLGSRSGKVTAVGQGLEERIAKIDSMPGVTCLMEKCDTSDEQSVIDALNRCRKNLGPIKVIIHAAGVLADMVIDMLDEGAMNKSFQPKADGAWYLHKHSLEDNLTAFVCFSSTSSLLGNPGQTNYSSSNAYMDTLCRYRVYHNLPACALMWPAVAEVGMAASGILKNLAFDPSFQVKPDVVKVAMRRVCCQSYPAEALVAVSPPAVFYPANPNMTWMTAPLWTFYRDEEAFKAAMEEMKEGK